MANQTININLDRKTVIERLLAKRKVFEYDYLDALKAESEYKAAMAEYYREIMTAVIDGLEYGKGEIDDVDVYSCNTRIRVNFGVDVKKPERSSESYYKTSDRLKSQMDEIDRTINLLEMCSDATIKSKQYGNILGLLF